MLKPTQSIMEVPDFAARLKRAMDARIDQLDSSLAAVARDLGISERKLAAWRSGENEPVATGVFRINAYFASRGLPGLLADMASDQRWVCDRQRILVGALPKMAQKLLDCLPEMRHAPSLTEYLAERDLLAHVHIMLRTDDEKVCMVHRGSKMKSAQKIDPDVYGRDIRQLGPDGYGVTVYPQIIESLGRGRPDLYHISSSSARYRRVGAPVGRFWVGLSFEIDFAPTFVLR
jgi:hypothetical protein